MPRHTLADENIVEVILDRISIKHVVECDTDEGWIEVAAKDEFGDFLFNDSGSLVIERKYGKVSVVRT